MHAAYLEAHGVRLEQRAVPFCGLPYVMTVAAFEAIGKRFQSLAAIVERVIDLYLTDRAVRDFFALAPRHERLIRMDAPYRPRVQYCRYDFTLGADGLPRVYELNTHCPAAMVFSYYYSDTYARSHAARRIEAAGLRPVAAPLAERGAFARAMLAAAERSGFLGRGRNVGVLNSRYLTMQTELDLVAQQFREQGCTAARAFVEDLTFDGERLRCGDLPLDLVFNKYDDSRGPDAYECAFSRTSDEVRAYLDAYAAGAVFAVNTFPAMYLTEQKSTLAFLWSPLMRPHLTQAERALVEEIVPRTYLCARLDANERQEILSGRERYVLKRSLDTRGRSVLIGRSTGTHEWEAALRDALAERPEDGFVVQEFVPAQAQLSHVEELGDETVFTSLACYLFGSRPVGLAVRSSVEETTNVGRRGFAQPLLLIETP